MIVTIPVKSTNLDRTDRVNVIGEVLKTLVPRHANNLQDAYSVVRHVFRVAENMLCPLEKSRMRLNDFEHFKQLSGTGGKTLHVNRIGNYILVFDEDGRVEMRKIPKDFQSKRKLKVNYPLVLGSGTIFHVRIPEN